MRNSSKLTVGLAILATLMMVDSALAYYSPRLGRFINRDPIGEPGFALVQQTVMVAGGMESSGFIPRDPEHVQEEGGSNRYAYVYNGPVNQIDPLGLKACSLDPPMEHDCCLCLLYSEAGGSPGCLQAYAWVMRNRQKAGWFPREPSFCAQAATGPASGRTAWAGGEGSTRYENCCVCLNNAAKCALNKPCPECGPNGDDLKCCPLTNPEAEAALRASDVCAQVRRGEGQDPTGGAQYVGTKGAVTNAVGAHNIPNPCKLFQVPGCSSWFAKCSRQPLAKR